MKAIISTTLDDKYQFFLPIVTFCWNKLGVDVICTTRRNWEFTIGKIFNVRVPEKVLLIDQIINEQGLKCTFEYFDCPEHKEATYAQCSRLFAGSLSGIHDDEVLIISDVDMAVFSKDILMDSLDIHIYGHDLVPPGQFPICYISMSKAKWKQVFRCHEASLQDNLDYHLGSLECDNFRGNFWARDQELAWTHISPHNYMAHKRAKPGTQFATRRLDRDDAYLLERLSPDIIDYHLPRPGYEEKNFEQIMTVLKYFYPNDDFSWIRNYRNGYIKLL